MRSMLPYTVREERRHREARCSILKRYLRCIAKNALADELTTRDFCAQVKPPKCRQYNEDRPNLLTGEQLGRVANEIPERWYSLFTTLADTGMRWGENSGLLWEDVDFARGCAATTGAEF